MLVNGKNWLQWIFERWKIYINYTLFCIDFCGGVEKTTQVGAEYMFNELLLACRIVHIVNIHIEHILCCAQPGSVSLFKQTEQDCLPSLLRLLSLALLLLLAMALLISQHIFSINCRLQVHFDEFSRFWNAKYFAYCVVVAFRQWYGSCLLLPSSHSWTTRTCVVFTVEYLIRCNFLTFVKSKC